jgi:predicted trehalose synthase
MRQVPQGLDVMKMREEVDQASDRSAAIIVGAAVDRYLEAAILERLERNDDETVGELTKLGGALSGLFAKTHLAYALGLFSKQHSIELECIRKIRNCFAHSAGNVTFETPAVAAECAKFVTPSGFRVEQSNKEKFVSAANYVGLILACHSLLKSLRDDVELRSKAGPGLAEKIQQLEDVLRRAAAAGAARE